MAIEWFYQSVGFKLGPVTSEELKQLAEEGTVIPSTPVRRRVGDEISPWTRAGAIQGLFPGNVIDQLGEPICDNCGRKLQNGNCPNCSPSPPPFSTPKDAQEKFQEASRASKKKATKRVVAMRKPDLINDLLSLLGVLLLVFALISLIAGIDSGYGQRFADDNAIGATVNALESMHTKLSFWTKFLGGMSCFVLAKLRRNDR